MNFHVVSDQASPEQVNLFLTESCLLKKTNHRNVLPVMHAGLEEGMPPIVILPYMNRGNLKNYMRLSRTAEPLSKVVFSRPCRVRHTYFVGKWKTLITDRRLC